MPLENRGIFILKTMREQQQNLIEYIKGLKGVRGCITGSCLLPEYHEDSDVDLFLYDSKAFTKMYYTLIHNSMFQITDKLEEWKANMFEKREEKYSKFGIVTIKMMYNSCIPINIILKNNNNNIFAVLSSFDMDIISKGYCLETNQYLDLSNGSTETKVANVNKWNTMYISDEVWAVSRVLRQLKRTIKYHQRGYNTDAVVLKYIELIDNIDKYESIFNSENFNEKLKQTKHNTSILKEVCNVWLKTHIITPEELTILDETIKNL